MRYSMRQLLAAVTVCALLLAVVPQVMANPDVADGVTASIQFVTLQGVPVGRALDSPAAILGCCLGLVYSCAVVATGWYSVRIALVRRS